MIVEISGAGFHNMGAELMLVAARHELMSWRFVSDVAINFRIGTRRQRSEAGTSSVLRLDSDREWARRAISLVAEATPGALLGIRGAYRPTSVGALVDASGFAFGDQWGPGAANAKAHLFESYAEAARPIVLLPQAFGPFERSEVARAAFNALNRVDLMFARDPESLAHVRGLGLTRPRIEMAADFTNLIEPAPADLAAPTVIVIPNGRMTQMVDGVTDDRYARFLAACASTALSCGFDVVAMAHEAMDIVYAETLSSRLGGAVRVQRIEDAVASKAIIGGASLVISSRFHGLVNALSQSVPAIGTSWSHKYAQLAQDYGCPEAIWDIDPPDVVEPRLREWLSTDRLAARRITLGSRSTALKEATRSMWTEVRSTISS